MVDDRDAREAGLDILFYLREPEFRPNTKSAARRAVLAAEVAGLRRNICRFTAESGSSSLTEGFDTADPKEAKALLDELS